VKVWRAVSTEAQKRRGEISETVCSIFAGRRIAASTVELLNSKPYVASGSTIRGGYIFIHRMLLEYFADLPAQHTSVKH
jgi:hypothetical protein